MNHLPSCTRGDPSGCLGANGSLTDILGVNGTLTQVVGINDTLIHVLGVKDTFEDAADVESVERLHAMVLTLVILATLTYFYVMLLPLKTLYTMAFQDLLHLELMDCEFNPLADIDELEQAERSLNVIWSSTTLALAPITVPLAVAFGEQFRQLGANVDILLMFDWQDLTSQAMEFARLIAAKLHMWDIIMLPLMFVYGTFSGTIGAILSLILGCFRMCLQIPRGMYITFLSCLPLMFLWAAYVLLCALWEHGVPWMFSAIATLNKNCCKRRLTGSRRKILSVGMNVIKLIFQALFVLYAVYLGGRVVLWMIRQIPALMYTLWRVAWRISTSPYVIFWAIHKVLTFLSDLFNCKWKEWLNDCYLFLRQFFPLILTGINGIFAVLCKLPAYLPFFAKWLVIALGCVVVLCALGAYTGFVFDGVFNLRPKNQLRVMVWSACSGVFLLALPCFGGLLASQSTGISGLLSVTMIMALVASRKMTIREDMQLKIAKVILLIFPFAPVVLPLTYLIIMEILYATVNHILFPVLCLFGAYCVDQSTATRWGQILTLVVWHAISMCFTGRVREGRFLFGVIRRTSCWFAKVATGIATEPCPGAHDCLFPEVPRFFLIFLFVLVLEFLIVGISILASILGIFDFVLPTFLVVFLCSRLSTKSNWLVEESLAALFAILAIKNKPIMSASDRVLVFVWGVDVTIRLLTVGLLLSIPHTLVLTARASRAMHIHFYAISALLALKCLLVLDGISNVNEFEIASLLLALYSTFVPILQEGRVIVLPKPMDWEIQPALMLDDVLPPQRGPLQEKINRQLQEIQRLQQNNKVPEITELPEGMQPEAVQGTVQVVWQYSFNGLEGNRPPHVIAIEPADELMKMGEVKGRNHWAEQTPEKMSKKGSKDVLKEMEFAGAHIINSDGIVKAHKFFVTDLNDADDEEMKALDMAWRLSMVEKSIAFLVRGDGGVVEFRLGDLHKVHCASREKGQESEQALAIPKSRAGKMGLKRGFLLTRGEFLTRHAPCHTAEVQQILIAIDKGTELQVQQLHNSTTMPVIDPAEGIPQDLLDEVFEKLVWKYAREGVRGVRAGHIIVIGPGSKLMNKKVGAVRGRHQWDGTPAKIRMKAMYGVANLAVYRQPLTSKTNVGSWVKVSEGPVTSIAIQGDTIYGIGVDKAIYQQQLSTMCITSSWIKASQEGNFDTIAIHDNVIYGIGKDGTVCKQDVNAMTTTSEWIPCSSTCGETQSIVFTANAVYYVGADQAIQRQDLYPGASPFAKTTVSGKGVSAIAVDHSEDTIYGVVGDKVVKHKLSTLKATSEWTLVSNQGVRSLALEIPDSTDSTTQDVFIEMNLDGAHVINASDGKVESNKYFIHEISKSEDVEGGSGEAAAREMSAAAWSEDEITVTFKISSDGTVKEFRKGKQHAKHCDNMTIEKTGS